MEHPRRNGLPRSGLARGTGCSSAEVFTRLAEVEVAIEVGDLRMRYGDNDVLTGVDFDVRTDEVVCLLGPNGAGKTTTIEILEGFRIRSGGQVERARSGPGTRRRGLAGAHRRGTPVLA